LLGKQRELVEQTNKKAHRMSKRKNVDEMEVTISL
jgi:hypothetical protein